MAYGDEKLVDPCICCGCSRTEIASLRAEVEAKDKRIAELEGWLSDLWYTHRATDLMYMRDDFPEIAKLVEGEH